MIKKKLSDLAIAGGSPAFKEPLHVGRPNIGNRDVLMKRINSILDHRWLSNNGPFVQKFEEKLKEYLNVKHVVALCNATIALELTTRALEMTGEVIVPSMTFVATAHALQWQQITPVFCDIDPHTYTINPNKIESMITPKTTGIIGVHLWGRPCNIDQLTQIAKRRNLKLVFDAAHALGCSYKKRMVGGFGNAEVFSFHATKFCNAFEGGAVATNDDKLASKIRLMSNFGFAGYDNVIYLGTNGKMCEPSAAMGLTSLENIDEFVKKNHNNYKQYQNLLEWIPGVKLIEYSSEEKNNYQYIVLEINKKITGLSRDRLLQVLHAEKVLARRYFYPGVHKMEPYRSYFPHANLLLPVTESLSTRVLSLPTGTSVDKNEIEVVCSIIRVALENSETINNILGIKSKIEKLNV